jgi:hypothetical protein
MPFPIRRFAFLAVGALCAAGTWACDEMTTLGNQPYDPTASSENPGDHEPGTDEDAGEGEDEDGGGGGDPILSNCAYTDDESFCKCNGWTCGGLTVKEKGGSLQTVYCGSCTNGEYCRPDSEIGPGVGKCGGKNPLHPYQSQKTDILVAIGENDNTKVNYDFAKDIKDGRGYTVGKVGFCTGTGDFIVVLACYNNLKPGNVLSKYWGTRDDNGKAKDGLIYYNDLLVETGENQGATTLIDKLGNFVKDVATAAGESDGIFRACQDSMADAFYLGPALQHAEARGLAGPLTIGFLYDMELNFGDEDDPGGTPGAITMMKKADADFGAGLPKDFAGKPWEESRWLGYVIKERTIAMSKDPTWKGALDQNATWEAARRLHTAKSATPETGTDLSMDYEFASKYKAASKGESGNLTPCWTEGLASDEDTGASIFVVTTDKTGGAADPAKWKAKAAAGGTAFASCPANPTP